MAQRRTAILVLGIDKSNCEVADCFTVVWTDRRPWPEYKSLRRAQYPILFYRDLNSLREAMSSTQQPGESQRQRLQVGNMMSPQADSPQPVGVRR